MTNTPFGLSPLVVNDACEEIYEHAAKVKASKHRTCRGHNEYNEYMEYMSMQVISSRHTNMQRT